MVFFTYHLKLNIICERLRQVGVVHPPECGFPAFTENRPRLVIISPLIAATSPSVCSICKGL